MKRTFLSFVMAAGLSLFVSIAAKAQTADATLTVTLADFASITIPPAKANVGLTFTTAQQYVDGVTATIEDQLVVVCNKEFSITVEAADLQGQGPASGNTIAAGGINVEPLAGNAAIVSTFTAKNLANTPGDPIIETLGGTTGVTYDIKYTAGGTGRTSHFIDKPAGAYTTTVTFTVIP